MTTREKRLGRANAEGSPWTREERPARGDRLTRPKQKRSLGALRKLQGYIATRPSSVATLRACMIRFSWDQDYAIGMLAVLMKAGIVKATTGGKPTAPEDLQQHSDLTTDPKRAAITDEEAQG